MDLFKLKQPLYEAYLPRLGPEIVGLWRKIDRFGGYGSLILLSAFLPFFGGLQTHEPILVIIGIIVYVCSCVLIFVAGIFALRAGKLLSRLFKQKMSWSNSPISRNVKKFDKWCNDHGLDPMALVDGAGDGENGGAV